MLEEVIPTLPRPMYKQIYILMHSGKLPPIQNFNITRLQLEMSSCDVSNCVLTRNSQLFDSISSFDAILFHGRDLGNLEHSDIPDQKKRRISQRYIFYLMESPQNCNFNYDLFNNFFNWTMTYRLDSDIPSPYKTNKKRYYYYYGKNYPKKNYPKLANKTGTIAWMASHCNTKSDRENYINELMKHIPVDIYGGCSYHATNYRGCKNCENIINKRYKFYLAFENSFCDDYVTEKLWNYIGSTVPVVMGQADYKAITPPHSIINILDFHGPKHLAAYLKQLIKNETEYLSYFSWQHLYKEKKISNPWCKLCQMLNNQELPNKNYKNLYKWWSVDSHCKAKGTHSWSKYASPTKSSWGELLAY